MLPGSVWDTWVSPCRRTWSRRAIPVRGVDIAESVSGDVFVGQLDELGGGVLPRGGGEVAVAVVLAPVSESVFAEEAALHARSPEKRGEPVRRDDLHAD